MILFGGADSTGGTFYSDVWVLSLVDKTWERVQPKSDVCPSGRHFHSCVCFERSLWIFGGSSNGIYQDVYKFNLDSGRWTAISSLGSLPSPRYGHSAVVYNDAMYIYGGFDGNGFACNDVCAFSFATLSWDKAVLAGAAQEAFHHSAVVYQGSMYTFGGYRKTYNEIQEFRFATKSWSFLHTLGSAPTPRWGHAAVVSGHHMYVFGGRDRVSNFQDLHSFDFETRTWRKIDCQGIEGRFFSAGTMYSDKYVYLYGGRNIHSFAFNDTLQLCLYDGDDAMETDLQPLVGDPEFADIVFVMPNDPITSEDRGKVMKESSSIPIPKEFDSCHRVYAHACIIRHRSSALATMLTVDMQEGRTGVVAMRDTSAACVHAMLVYLYTDRIRCNESDLMQLMALANQWQLFYLKLLCQEKMMHFITLENCTKTLELSHQLDAPILFETCRQFIFKNMPLLDDQMQTLDSQLIASVKSLASPPVRKKK